MKTFSKKQFITSFSAALSPAYSVDINEVFKVETSDCYGGAFTSETQKRTELNIPSINPATGPVNVNGVKAGDVLKVNIHQIELENKGVMALYPGMGPLGHLVKHEDTKLYDIQNGYVPFTKQLNLPLSPMIGVLGVAPQTGTISTEAPGNHGGNMDTKYIKAGNTVYFPVFQDGALLALGDLHASMGDGELNGSGIEIGGTVTLSAEKLTGVSIMCPVVESDTHWMFIVSAATIEEATNKGLQMVTSLLEKAHELNFNDAYRLLSATCDLEVSQIVNPLVSVRIVVPKYCLPSFLS